MVMVTTLSFNGGCDGDGDHTLTEAVMVMVTTL